MYNKHDFNLLVVEGWFVGYEPFRHQNLINKNEIFDDFPTL